MGLRTVKVPPGFAELFEQAEATVAEYFASRHDDPSRGTIEIHEDRYVLIRAAALSVEFFSLVRDLFGPGQEAEAIDFARNILFDLAHAVGRSDAQRFHKQMSVDDPIARLAAGPVHFAYTGWAFVDIHPESRPAPDESYYLQYDHPHSFEADAWIEVGRRADFPVCIMNAGYSSGWCEESFGLPLVASEILCRARGDEACRFIMAHPSRAEEFVREYAESSPHVAERIEELTIPDFFARKRMEEELRRARDELEDRVLERTAELREAYERLRREMAVREEVERELVAKQKLEALGRMAGGIAHDFNNLMTVVIGQSCLLESLLEEADPNREHASAIREAGERAAAISKQLLAFGRTQLLKAEQIDLNDFVRDALRLLERAVGEELELAIKLRARPSGVVADRSQLTQVLFNLVLNARDAMPDGGTVRIETDTVDAVDEATDLLGDVAEGGWVRLSITDQGRGMDEETMSRIFEPYFSTKDEGRGTGLGLSTVYGIVRQSGGGIRVTTPEGSGARFEVFLPLVEGFVETVPRAEPPSRLPRGDETILVVEDQAAPRALVVRVLQGLGYTILEAATAAAALEIVETRSDGIDLVLTDVVMPQMSGPELIAELLEAGSIRRYLYMSGYVDDESFGTDLVEEGAELLAKPFTPKALAVRVRKVLDAPWA